MNWQLTRGSVYNCTRRLRQGLGDWGCAELRIDWRIHWCWYYILIFLDEYMDERSKCLLTDFHILCWGMRGQGGQMAVGFAGDKSGLMLWHHRWVATLSHNVGHYPLLYASPSDSMISYRIIVKTASLYKYFRTNPKVTNVKNTAMYQNKYIPNISIVEHKRGKMIGCMQRDQNKKLALMLFYFFLLAQVDFSPGRLCL